MCEEEAFKLEIEVLVQDVLDVADTIDDPALSERLVQIAHETLSLIKPVAVGVS
jgi:hypothetical protein